MTLWKNGLVWLFNGISTLFRLFNAILLEEQSWYYLTHSWEDKGVHTFPKGICPKVNVIVRLEYELAYYDSTVQRFTHYTTRTPPWKNDHGHHQHQVLITQISFIVSLPHSLSLSLSLSLSCYTSQSFITFDRSSRWHLVSAHFASRPTLVCPWVGVHKKTPLMCSSLLLPAFPSMLFLTNGLWDGSRLSYRCCFIKSFVEDLSKISNNILV